jgi:hypothetical protein
MHSVRRARVKPTDAEYALAYEILRPVPWDRSPKEHVAALVAHYREELVSRLQEMVERWEADAKALGRSPMVPSDNPEVIRVQAATFAAISAARTLATDVRAVIAAIRGDDIQRVYRQGDGST